ncbi:MAG: glycosyltransferase [Planctomycetes bacterium]|nr:glycosyltransferase [Planctomycetota bacterium]
MRRADRVLVCSEKERAQLSVLGVDHVLVVPNGVDTQQFTPRERSSATAAPLAPPRAEALELVFTGGMNYLPNEDGARWFLDEIFPLVLRERPAARITFVGKHPPDSLCARAREGQIVFTGRVDDVRAHARAADIFVVPLRIGGGTRLKILEALAMQLPLVSTRVGAEGLDLRDGQDLLLADEAQTFADAILALATDRERAARLAASGHARVLERYDWRATTRPLLDDLAN